MNNEVTVTEKPSYKPSERAIAVALLAVGYVFKLFVVDMAYMIGAVIGMYLLYGVGLALMKLRGAKISKPTLAFLIPGLIMPLALVFTSSETVGFLVRTYSAVAYSASVYYAFGNKISDRFGDMLFFEVVKALFVMPLSALGEWFRALFQSRNGKKTAKTVISAVAGLLFAVIPTGIVILLLSYDDAFSAILDNISFADVFRVVWNLIFAAVFSAVTFGDAVAASLHKGEDVLTSDKCGDTERRAHIIPIPMLTAFVIPLLAVYSIFFASQSDYYVSAFTGSLPSGLSYADYARNGFFELCAVAGINAVVLAVIELFGEQTDGKKPLLTRIISVVYSAVTLALLATAASKMVMYIGMYGLTQARVYASWFMLFLAVCFVVLIVSQIKKIRTLLAIFVAGTVMLAGLAFSGVDARIAEYNVNAYLDGRLDAVDIDAMYSLSEDAVPHVLRLLDGDIDDSLRTEIMRYASAKKAELGEKSLFEMNVPRFTASAKLSKFDIVIPEPEPKTEADDRYVIELNLAAAEWIEEMRCYVSYGDMLMRVGATGVGESAYFVIMRADVADVPESDCFTLVFDALIDGEYREIKGQIDICPTDFGYYTARVTKYLAISDARYRGTEYSE